jgi:nitrite reductase/ring-hydroxylating ferredoxin subunit
MKTVMTNKQWAAKYPQVGTGPVAAEPCVSPEYFERERDLIFRRAWVNVGRVDEVERPGQYFVRELAVCRTSIIIVRGKDGVVRGFHNVCSHRGNKLVGTSAAPAAQPIVRLSFMDVRHAGKLAWVPDERTSST